MSFFPYHFPRIETISMHMEYNNFILCESLFEIMELKLWVSSQLLPRTHFIQQKKSSKALFTV